MRTVITYRVFCMGKLKIYVGGCCVQPMVVGAAVAVLAWRRCRRQGSTRTVSTQVRERLPVRYTLYTPDVAYRVGCADIRCIHMACLTERDACARDSECDQRRRAQGDVRGLLLVHTANPPCSAHTVHIPRPIVGCMIVCVHTYTV
jgi:hypothetical protein